MEQKEQQFSTVIVPKTGWFDFHLKEVFHYRDLIFLFVKRNFVSQYKQTILGPAWALIQPLLTTVVFTVVFGNLAGLAADGVPSFLFFMSGNIAWAYFSGCLTSTANTFTGNAGIFGKIYFPRLVSPISTVLTNLISFGIQFLLFFVFLVIYWSGTAHLVRSDAASSAAAHGHAEPGSGYHHLLSHHKVPGFENAGGLWRPALDVRDAGGL